MEHRHSVPGDGGRSPKRVLHLMSPFLCLPRCFIICVLYIAGCLPAVAQSDVSNLTATQILERTYDVYATCDSYSDTGSVTNIAIDQRGKSTYVKTFQTAFSRPDQFRFQYTADDHTYIVWMNRDDIQKWWTVSRNTERIDSLGSALAAAVGVSSTTSVIVPSLLLPETVRMRKLISDEDAVRQEDGRIGDTNCFRLNGTRHSWLETTVWIDSETFLVRQIEMDGVQDGVGRRRIVKFDGEVNQSVGKTKLEFNHP